MMSPFCMAVKANNDEEYKKVIKNRINIAWLILTVGILTIATLTVSTHVFNHTMNDHIHGIYAGFGTGLILAGGVLFLKNRRILGNETLLKESRIKNTDERIQEISVTALRTATFTLLIAIYAVCFIGGLIFPDYMEILSKILLIQVAVFLVGYAIAFQVYNRKM